MAGLGQSCPGHDDWGECPCSAVSLILIRMATPDTHGDKPAHDTAGTAVPRIVQSPPMRTSRAVTIAAFFS
jgi:hypothetical protein